MEFKAETLVNKMKGLNTVLQMDGLDNRANYGFMRMAPVIETEYRSFEDARRKLIEEHADRDDEGEMKKTAEQPDGQFDIVVDQEAYQEAYNALASEIIVVNVQPVRMSLIIDGEASVNAGTLIQLGELLDDDIEGEEGKPPLEIVENSTQEK